MVDLEHFKGYYDRAKYLQDNSNLGGKPYNSGDPLMDNNPIYDCVERRYAGFSNVPQDYFLRHENPKWYKQTEERKQVILNYQSHDTVTQWWMLLVHRCTGSGASFGPDHGYRNSIVHHLPVLIYIDHMIQTMLEWKQNNIPMFTSIGNQPPAPKKGVSNVDFLTNEAPNLLRTLYLHVGNSDRKWTHKEVVDFLNDYNIQEGHRRFNFAYSAFAMDLSDYYPELVDEDSHCYIGNNAKRAVKEVFGHQRFDEAMDILRDTTGGKPKDLEDVLCDYVRYLKGYTFNE